MEKIGNWFVDEAQDEMSDQLHRVASVRELVAEGGNVKEEGMLVISSKIFSYSVLPFLYFSFPRKIFSKREEDVKFRARVDKNPPIDLIFNPSDTGKDAHVDNPGQIYVPLIEAESLLVDLPTMSTIKRMKFNISGFDDVLEWFLQGMLMFPVADLRKYNSSIVDSLLRRGPKSLECIFETLKSLGYLNNKDIFFGKKTKEIFEAVHRFAQDYRASEIFGLFETQSRSPNNSWSYSLYNHARGGIKERWGKLKISD